MPNPHVFIVHNPVAGTSDPQAVQRALRTGLEHHGRDFRLYETTGKESVRDLVREAVEDGADCVWAAGGDGTVSQVANALVGGDVPMGIIPIGTGNALARELGVPLDAGSACALLLGDHEVRRLDALRVEDQYFILAVSVGVGARTMAETARAQKRRLGRLAYLLNGVRILLTRSLWPFTVRVDGRAIRLRASEVIAANAGIIGFRPIRWGTEVRPDDGVVDLCSVQIASPRALFALLAALLFKQQDRAGELACFQARTSIEIDSRGRMPVQGDGDPIGHTPVRIEIASNALPVLAPRPSP